MHRHHRFVAGAPIILALAGAWLTAASAAAPAFTHPLDITNRYQPFQVGGTKLFTGEKEGQATAVADLYLDATRTFRVGGADVATHILQETEFADGSLVEISRNFFAQADDGTLYYFGEIVDEYDRGVVVSHDGSWLVGGPTDPTDPTDTATASVPAVFMPANPAVGDRFKAEDLFPIVDETVEVKRVGVSVTVPAGRFTDSIRVLETTMLGPDRETKWYAPGVGVVRTRAKRERLELIASTLGAA
jgi:hypothetical protein